MAINSKIAGIVAGLGVGLGAGVVLAVLNPLISNTDGTAVQQSPTVSIGNTNQDEAPVRVSMVTDEATIIKPMPRPQAGQADQVPTTDSAVSREIRAGRVGGIQTPAEVLVNPVTLPQGEDQTKPGGEAAAGLAIIIFDPTPEVSTYPANPIEMAEPDAETGAQVPVAPAAGSTATVATPTTDTSAIAASPKPIEPASDEVALLPERPKNPGQPGRKRVFDTGSSQLETTGTAGFGIRAAEATESTLPKIGDTAPETETSEPETALNALQDFSVPFDKTDKPLISIILIDLGDAGLPLDVLRTLSLTVTFAIKADDPAAQARAQAFRAAGFEVLAMLPESEDLLLAGNLSDFQASEQVDRILAAVPEAIGLIDQPKAAFQKNRKLAKSVIAHLQPTGHGLITYYKGLNTVPREAQLAGLASGSVLRVLDGKGEADVVITRYMNRAALDARRAGHVIVLGTTAQSTVAALANWALSSQARGVALAPVSASLRESLE